MTDREGIKWIKERLRRADRKTFRMTALYNVLRRELSALDYWKAQRRGNPRKGGLKTQQILRARGVKFYSK